MAKVYMSISAYVNIEAWVNTDKEGTVSTDDRERDA